MAVSLVSTGVQFPDNSIQTTAASAGGKALNFQSFTASGTWTKPSGYGANSRVFVQCWGGGGSGAVDNVNGRAGGGGGGAYNEGWFLLSALTATVNVTVGAGGALAGGSRNGNNGGVTVFGVNFLSCYILAWNGEKGYFGSGLSGSGGGGGGQLGAGGEVTVGAGGRPFLAAVGRPGSPGTNGVAANNGTLNSPMMTMMQGGAGSIWNNSPGYSAGIFDSYLHGGGGGSWANFSCFGGGFYATEGGSSVYGGGGGGAWYSSVGTIRAGGKSTFGGAGGASNSVSGIAGTAPGGGGGGAGSASGAGAAGQVYVTVFDGV